MATVALQQVSSPFAKRNSAKTLEKPIGLKYVRAYLDKPTFQGLESHCPDGKVYVWGAKAERAHQVRKMLPKNCLVLFRRGAIIFKRGVIIESVESAELAQALWGFDEDGETWSLVYFLRRLQDLNVLAAKMNKILRRSPNDHWQGLTAIDVSETERWREFVKAEIGGEPNSAP
jgi:hypothetical protein